MLPFSVGSFQSVPGEAVAQCTQPGQIQGQFRSPSLQARGLECLLKDVLLWNQLLSALGQNMMF